MCAQFNLFDEPELPPPVAAKSRKMAARILPISWDAQTIARGAALPRTVYLGTSSWSFPGWQGLIYSAPANDSQLAHHGLEAYAKHPLLRCVGIDRTFYAPLGEAEFARYARQVPPFFRFLVKAPMACTSTYVRAENGEFSDNHCFLDATYATEQFVVPCTQGLAEKAGPLVFQFPPQGRMTTRNPDPFINRLYRFLKALPQGPLYAVEIRDAELLTHRFFMALKNTAVRYCIGVHPNMPPVLHQIELMSVLQPGPLIARWGLHAGFKYDEAKARYAPFNKLVDEDPDSRHALAHATVQALRAGHTTYITANNKAEGSAPLTLDKLAQAIQQRLEGP